MPIHPQTGDSTPKQQPKPGLCQAVVAAVVDMGEAVNTYAGETKIRPKVLVIYELNQRMEDNRRFVKSITYTNTTFNKGNLYRDVKGLMGSDFPTADFEAGVFDLETLVGRNCMVNLGEYTTRAGKEGIGIDSVVTLMDGMEPISVELDGNDLPSWIADQQAKNKLEVAQAKGETPPTAADFDDVPF